MDMDLVFDKEAPVIREYLEGFALVERQVGAVFLVNGKVVGMDAFGKAVTFSRVFKNLLESYALDAVNRFEKKTDAGNVAKAASDVLAAASGAKAESRPSVGLGMDLRLESNSLIGFALQHEGRVVHICLFPNTGNRKADGSTRMARHSTRRQRRGL
jgi:hypothetical protein